MLGDNGTTVQPVAAAMLQFQASGFGVLPVKDDKTKAPAVDWKQYEDTPPSLEQVKAWAAAGYRGLGVICGKSSGNLEMLEFEGRAWNEGVYTQFTELLANYKMTALWQRIAGGYLEFSPSGGIHVLYRISDQPVGGNEVFARRAETDEEMAVRPWTKADTKRGEQTRLAKTLIETRGQGGYTVVAPTEKECHELGKPYVLAAGSPETVADITWGEREKLANVAAELSTWVPQASEWGGSTGRVKRSGGPAGMAYAAEHEWADILTDEGWELSGTHNGDDSWLHPLATSKRSALTKEHTLTVFSSSTSFGTKTPVSVGKFEAYAVFNHDGDFTAAELALRAAGYGDYTEVRANDQLAAFNGDEAAQQRLAAADQAWETLPSYVPRPAVTTVSETEQVQTTVSATPPDMKTPEGALVLPPPFAPLAVADFIHARYSYRGLPTLMRRDQSWMKWNGTHWDVFEDEAMERTVYDLTRKAVYTTQNKEGGTDTKRWVPNRAVVGNVIHALSSVALVPASTARGGWLNGSGPVVIPCANGLLDIRNRVLLDPTPLFFGLAHVNAAWDVNATCPRWLKFLHDLWAGDPDSIRLLRQWFGYVISGRTDLGKILLVTGPKRAGKGTIARVMEALSAGAFSGPTLGSLGQHFGLEPLLGKTLAVVSDMRLSPKDDRHLMTERLLAISGEDPLDVERKHKGGAVTGVLPVRFALMSNEIPQFPDAAGAVASRFVMLTMKRSFYGIEDITLKAAVLAELPGIINWALEGLADLEYCGRFIETVSSSASRDELREGSSEYLVFAEERLVQAPGEWVQIQEVYQDWIRWAGPRGSYTGDIRTFGRMLRAAVPELEVVRRGPAGEQKKCYANWKLKPVTLFQPGVNGYGQYPNPAYR
jgi:putative DNA primase/helicase